MTDRSRTLSFLKRKHKSDEDLLVYEDDDWKFEDEEEEQTIPNVIMTCYLFFNFFQIFQLLISCTALNFKLTHLYPIEIICKKKHKKDFKIFSRISYDFFFLLL